MDLIELLNRWAVPWAGFMWARLIDTTLTLAVVGALWLLLRRWRSPQLGYCLFLLVLLKLIIPIEISLPTWTTYLSPREAVTRTADWAGWPGPPWLAPHGRPFGPIDGAGAPTTYDADKPIPAARMTGLGALMLGWAVVVVVLLLRLAWMQWRTHRLVHRATLIDAGKLPVDLDRLRRLAGVRRRVRLVASRSVASPVVWGILRPRLIVPVDFFESFTPSQISWVLLHELAHIRRADIAVAAVQKALQSIYFFNPAVWLTNWMVDLQREYACDDAALAASDAPRSDCGEGFLSIVRRANSFPTFMTTPLGLLNRNTLIRRRMMRILDTNRKLHIGLSASSIVFLLAVAVIVLPSVRAEDTRIAENRTLALAETEKETSPTKSLHEAAADGDIELVKALISKGADVNARDDKGITPLHLAALRGQKEVVEFLIANGADINAKGEQGYTPLYYAIWGVQKDTVGLLIAKGADVNFAQKDGYPPLHNAVWMEDIDIVKLLVDNGAKLDVKDQDGWTAFRYAATQGIREIVEFFVAKGADVSAFHGAACVGDLARVKSLVEQGANVDTEDELGWTPLHWAASTGREDVAEFLIAQGANIHAKTNDDLNRTPLHQAAQSGTEKLVDTLMSKDADVNAKDKREDTPLHLAAGAGHRDVVELLIASGADVGAKDKGGKTPLLYAAWRGRGEVVDLLMAKGADINAKDDNSRTLLHYATGQGNRDMVEFLIAHGADVRARDNKGKPPLASAVYSDQKEVVDLLISKGADINASVNEWGGTLLYEAAGNGQTDRVEFLLSRGADIEAKNMWGVTPLHKAVVSNQAEMVKFLIEHGADIEARTTYDTTPLLDAVAQGQKDMVELLLAKGADITTTRRGETAIYRAMMHNQGDMVRFLLGRGLEASPINVAAYFGELDKVKRLVAQGSSVDIKDDTGFRPLHCAVCAGHKDVVEFLISRGADVNGRDIADRTPLGFAATLDVATVLIAKGADVNIQDALGETPLHWAVNRDNHRGDKQLVDLLLAHGANPNAKANVRSVDWEGWTPFHVACRNGNKAIVEILIAHAADVNARTDKGETPISLATKEGHAEIVELLREHAAKE